MSTKKKETLADKIASLLVTAPSIEDPEDEVIDGTKAKFGSNPAENLDDDDTEEELLSKFRKQNVDLLADIDSRYAGKRGSRANLRDSDRSSDEDDFHESNEDYPEEQSESDASDSVREDVSDDYEDRSENDEEDNLDEKNKDVDMLENENNDNYKHIKEADVSAHIRKGMCVRKQLNIWENLLEMRIQLQKSVIAANRMPNHALYAEIKKSAGTQFSSKVNETTDSLSNLLEKLLLLQQLVLKRYPETKNMGKEDTKEVSIDINGEDEEIPSDTEESENSGAEENESKPLSKKRKLSNFENEICKRHKMYKTYRNNVIQKWHDKTRIVVMKSNTGSHSVINHIEHTLSDREKLLRRTQLKRGDYQIIGEKQDDFSEQKNNEDNIESRIKEEEYNTEIFDDDDFYHQLLRELIEVKSADVTDPVQLGRQWIQLQNLRSKMKRKIDTRATKGRKIRYAVHTKLVNFMAPIIAENSWTDEAKTELFSSLFGKNK